MSGVYYGSESEELSLAGLELAYENEVLDKEKDYIDLARYFMYKELPIKAVDVLNNGISIEKVKKNKKKIMSFWLMLISCQKRKSKA